MTHESEPQFVTIARRTAITSGVLAVSGAVLYGIAVASNFIVAQERPRQQIENDLATQLHAEFNDLGIAERFMVQYQYGTETSVSPYQPNEWRLLQYKDLFYGAIGQTCLDGTSYALRTTTYDMQIQTEEHRMSGPKGDSYRYYTDKVVPSETGAIAGPASFSLDASKTSITIFPVSQQADALRFTVDQTSGELMPDADSVQVLQALGCTTDPMQIDVSFAQDKDYHPSIPFTQK